MVGFLEFPYCVYFYTEALDYCTILWELYISHIILAMFYAASFSLCVPKGLLLILYTSWFC